MTRKEIDTKDQASMIDENLRMPDKVKLEQGRVLAKLRKEHKHSQKSLALLLGRSAKYISFVEEGKTFFTLEECYAICKLYDISIKDLFKNILPEINLAEVNCPEIEDFTKEEFEAIKRFFAYIERV